MTIRSDAAIARSPQPLTGLPFSSTPCQFPESRGARWIPDRGIGISAARQLDIERANDGTSAGSRDMQAAVRIGGNEGWDALVRTGGELASAKHFVGGAAHHDQLPCLAWVRLARAAATRGRRQDGDPIAAHAGGHSHGA